MARYSLELIGCFTTVIKRAQWAWARALRST
jgi:hypothetical protein